ncbi:MAG: adenine-specific methyltransferase EcoRI family protein, partial [Alphaproteobacteria bacterium]|nr:adenine-specific methyltransferase EcoRI family protein [Alphaproteobacteria bacterium]
ASGDARNRNLHQAKVAKKDEFYTQLADIEQELRHYKRHFGGKVVYCNCDDPTVSNFFKYFSFNFEKLGLKRLIATCYKNTNAGLFSRHDEERGLYLEYTGDKNGNRIPDPEEIAEMRLKGDGDFRSEECVALLKQADIVVTNPPFSLFREYVAQLVEHDKKFLVIGNLNAIINKRIFPLIKDNRLWLGNKPTGTDMLFDVPKAFADQLLASKKLGSGYKIINNVVKGRSQVVWFTNLKHEKRNEEIPLYKRYTTKEYPKYDNYDAIEVGKVDNIPMDYAGVMGVPITFLGKYNPGQFEILGCTQRGCHDEVVDTRKYDGYWEVRQDGTKTGSSGGKTNENANLLGNDGRKNYFTNGERVVQSQYGRIFIRNKNPQVRK